MNKKIICGVAIFIVIIVLLLILLKLNSNSEEESAPADIINDLNMIKNLSADDIQSIKGTLYTEGGAAENVITDRESIAEILKRLEDIQILKESKIGTDDDGLTIVIKTENNELKFVFEGNNIVYGKKQYEVSGLGNLKGYIRNLEIE